MKDLDSPEHEALRHLLREKRQKLRLTQEQVAQRLGRSQRYVSVVESGQHRVSLVEFLRFAAALEFDPCAAVRRVARAATAAPAKTAARR